MKRFHTKVLIEESPLAHGQLDEDPNDLEFYGVDPDGPSPFEHSNNNVVVSPATLPVEHQSLQANVLEQIGPLTSSTQMGIAIKLMTEYYGAFSTSTSKISGPDTVN